MRCQNCGAEIEKNAKFCQFCGSSISPQMIRELELLNKAGCPRCGSTNITFNREKQGEIKGKRGTTVVRSTVGICKDCGYTWQVTSAPPRKSKTWLWVLGWIFCFPIPITILIIKSNKMSSKQKYGLIAALWIAFLLIGLANNHSEPIKENAGVTMHTEMQSARNTPPTEPTETDLEIIRRVGHPTYYGSNTAAHAVWGDLEKGKIHFADDSTNYSSKYKPIIYLDGYTQGEKNEIIREVVLYLSNCADVSEGVNVATALQIASEYLPYDIIDEWYEFNRSYCIVPLEDNVEDKEIDFFISYRLTQEGSDAYYAKKHNYSGSIDVHLEGIDEEHITTISIGFGTPRWTSSLDLNGMKQVDWEYDFLSNR